MTINSDIRDQAYQFFVEEAPELLQTIEMELLTLKTERSTAKVHGLMRAAHSIKGGAASVGLDAIKIIAHRLEDIFNALYNKEIEIDDELESLLLQAYDGLRSPLMMQISTGQHNEEGAISSAEPVFSKIEARLGDFLNGAQYLPTSFELGVDIVLSIFEVDVEQALSRLDTVLAHPQDNQVGGELRAQADVFFGIAELLSLPGFGAIAKTALQALDAHPDRALEIAQLSLHDFRAAQAAVLAGDRAVGGAPSPALTSLATSSDANGFNSEANATDPPNPLYQGELQEIANAASRSRTTPIPALEDIFGDFDINAGTDTATRAIASEPKNANQTPTLEDVFGNFDINIEPDSGIRAIASEPKDANQTPTLEDVFGNFDINIEPDSGIRAIASEPKDATPMSALELDFGMLNQNLEAGTTVEPHSEAKTLDERVGGVGAVPREAPHSDSFFPPSPATPEDLLSCIESIEQAFDSLPPVETDEYRQDAGKGSSQSPLPPIPRGGRGPEFPNSHAPNATPVATTGGTPATRWLHAVEAPSAPNPHVVGAPSAPIPNPQPQLSVRVDLERLERMNNLVGELAIARNGLSLQNNQLQGSVRELLNRFARFQEIVGQLRRLSDQMLVKPIIISHSSSLIGYASLVHNKEQLTADAQSNFDSLEMDSYGELNSLLSTTLEEMVQLEEAVADIVLFAGYSGQTIEQQRQMLTHLRDELMWARMLPLGDVLNRFPRILRDLSTTYHKPVDLKITGTGVLVDKVALEKLYDPLLHLLRNAFDHGIESTDLRVQRGKPARGQIEIRAYHRGSQTIIEVRDDGQGLNMERIRDRVRDMGFLSDEELAATSNSNLLNYIFEPGFSTATKVSELSGRGVGLDVVRSQLRALKGNVTVTSKPGDGTTFTLRLPLTLTIARLLVCMVGSSALAFPSDGIEEIVIPKSTQIKRSGEQQFLHWREQIIAAYKLSELLDYRCLLPETAPSKAMAAVPTPADWALPMLILKYDKHILALEVDRLIAEQELVIKPFGAAIAAPAYIYGCTILGDGSLIPVIDGALLLHQLPSVHQNTNATDSSIKNPVEAGLTNATKISRTTDTKPVPTVLVVDDSTAQRQTLALTLQKAGYRVLQARDGRDAIEQLQRSAVQLVICDIEMPNMNGFEFLSQRRQDSSIAKIPVVMLTSRSSDKHRQLAARLGATAYFTKPYLEQEFLTALQSILVGNGDC